MSDDKKTDGGAADDAAKRLAEQRKALNLQTQPLEVIADLDWGVDDDDDVFVPPAAAAPAKAEPAKAEPVKAEPAKAEPAKAERAPVSSGGTMMMSTADFAQSLGTEPAPAKEAEAPAPAAQPAAAEPAAAEPAAAAPKAEAAAPQSDGGTMLMSTSAITAQLEQEAVVRAAQETPLAAHNAVASEAAGAEDAPVEHEPQRPEWDEAPARETTAWANPNADGGTPAAPAGRNLLYIAIAVVAAIILLIVILLFVPSGGDSTQVEGAPAETSEEG